MYDLTGAWQGHTIGIDTSTAHLWLIMQRGNQVDCFTRWEDETTIGEHFKGYISQENILYLYSPNHDAHGITVDKDHWQMKKWVYAIVNKKRVPYYDVDFVRREGLLQREVEFLLDFYDERVDIRQKIDAMRRKRTIAPPHNNH